MPTATRRQHVSQSELAELLGKHRTTIAAWIEGGLPVAKRRGPRGALRIELGAALRWILAELDERCEERVAAITADPDASRARARKLAAEAALREDELATRRRELLPRAEVVEDGRAAVAAVVAGLRALPARLLQAGALEQAAVRHAEDVVAEVLREMSAWQSRLDLLAAADAANRRT